MILRKKWYSRYSLQVCLIGGCICYLFCMNLLPVDIGHKYTSLFVPLIETDHKSQNGVIFYPGFLINTKGCRIPDLDPMDKSIQKFIYDEDPLDCAAQYGPALVESNLTAVYINESVLPYYNVTDVGQISCCYRPFWRLPLDVNASVRFQDYCTSFSVSAIIDFEFVKIECFVGNSSVYTDYHAFFPKNLSLKHTDPEKSSMNVKDNISVLIFGIDGVSRLNMYRQMPQTLKFLKKTLNAVEMLGYNKVADNTFPNLIPVLTGLSDKELKYACWPNPDLVFDDCNFIWDDFSNLGYKTVFGEDAHFMGIFTVGRGGFRKQPTDYYMRPFNKIAENTIGFKNSSVFAKLCVGPKKTSETLINYASKFLITMKGLLTFAFFWGASISHDYLNFGKYCDNDYKVFLESLYTHGILNNTVVVFMSDHGIRYGKILETYQGHLEERLPFLFVVYPDWFGSKYTAAVNNLRENSQKLTTPFDLHELLKDLTNLMQVEQEVLKKRSEESEKANGLPRGISLFLPISGDRTCLDAGIDDHWCTCHQSKNISTKGSMVKQASNYLVKHMNILLYNFTQCAKLNLSKIVQAREEKSTSHSKFKTSNIVIIYLNVIIQTTPGNGMFESTLRYDTNMSFTVVGTISRINLYRDQSRCMPNNYELRLYCYCIYD